MGGLCFALSGLQLRCVAFKQREKERGGERGEKSVLCQEKLREVCKEAITSHRILYLPFKSRFPTLLGSQVNRFRQDWRLCLA